MKYPQLVSMPSAVSDWLEEQLEVRGIDSALYSRYILSLLHAHTVEVIHPEDDLTFSGLKPNGGKQKRVRRAGSRWWRRHADANAERIKRSAAVECLMSAVEQNCEVESLIDELCEKLKQINSESSSSPNNLTRGKTIRKPFEQRNSNPKEQAEQYFQAFPPLNHKQENSYFSNINLVAGKWPSSNKDHIDLITTKWSAESPKKFNKRKPKRPFYENMKPICKSNHPRHNKSGFKRNHFGKSLTREMADNIANWEFVYNNNNNYKNQEDQCLDFNEFPEDIDMHERDENDSPICRMNLWLKNAESEKDFKTIHNNAIKRGETSKKNAEYISLYPTSIWSDDTISNNEWAHNNWSNNQEEEEEEEEESAIREEYQHQLKQAKLETESAIKEEYSRTIDGQSGNFDVNCNETIGGTFTSNVNMLSPCQIESDIYNFGLVDAGNELERQDDHFTIMENDTNNVLECLQTLPAVEGVPVNQTWWDDAPKNPLVDDLIDEKTISLMMVNHSKENSAFCEYSRTASSCFSSATYQPLKLSSLKVIPVGFEKASGLKRASPAMYFEPIKPVQKQIVNKEDGGQKLKDGTTFNIRGSPDKVKFSKTPDGSLLLESDSGELKRYLEYNCNTPNDESFSMPAESTISTKSNEQFRIKYSVCSNDKSCQTIEGPYLLPEHEESYEINVEPIFDDSNLISEDFEIKESFLGDFENGNDFHMEEQEDEPDRPDSLCETDEVVWGYAPKSSDVFCKYCNIKHPWPDNNPLKKLHGDLDERTLKDIWGGTETCTVCPWSTKAPTPLIETTTKLREESKEEAERLLSDLSSLQLSYSARLSELEAPFSVVVRDGPREKKRRHSYMNSDMNVWSFATRIQEDCFINLSTLPARRSVTL